MPRQIGKLVVRSGEEEGRVLTSCDTGYHGTRNADTNGRQSSITRKPSNKRGKKAIVTSVKHQKVKEEGRGHPILSLEREIVLKKKKKKDVSSLVNFDANQRLMASRFRGASRFFWAQSEFTCWS